MKLRVVLTFLLIALLPGGLVLLPFVYRRLKIGTTL